MSPSNDSTPKVAQFDGTNYPLWALKIKMYLVSKKLWKAVDATSGVSEAKEQQAHAAIVTSLSDNQLMHVITTSSALKAWVALVQVHRTQDMASRLWLQEIFPTFKCTAPDMSAHVLELERLMLDMNGVSCGPSEEDTCATLLQILPAQYESFVQAFRMSVTQFSFKDLVSKLNAEEVRKKDLTRVEDETALHVGKPHEKKTFTERSGGQRKTGSSVQCYNCGKRGHYARDCRNKNMIGASGKKITRMWRLALLKEVRATAGSWTAAQRHICARREARLSSTPNRQRLTR